MKLLKHGQARKASTMLEELLAQQPNDLEVQFWLGRSYVAAHEYDRAVAQFKLVLRAKPDSRESWVWLGEALAGQGDEAGTKAARAKAAELAPPARSPDPAAPAGRQTSEKAPDIADAQAAERAPSPEHTGEAELPLVGFRGANLKVSPAELGLHSDNIYDYTFTGAPTDWYMRGGRWEQVNRWTCTPTWSWFGGQSADLAALWNKRDFGGDLSVEVWAAMKMGFHPTIPDFSSYINPSDIDITICGDGANLSSGYSFIFGGWLNRFTRIMKGTQVLAETHDDAFVLPRFEDGWPGNFHRRWYNLKVVKEGGTLALYFDNQLALKCVDPDPLPGGRIALWTYGSGMVVARARICYQTERMDRPPIVLPVPAEPPAPRGPGLVFTSDLYPSIQDDFENGVGQWKNRDGDSGATLSLVDAGPGRAGKCLRLTNANSGGTFGATALAQDLDPRKLGQIRFDYRCGPDVKLNLYTVVNGQLYETRFTGNGSPAIDGRPLGAIEGVEADGKWHHAWFDLCGHLSRLYPPATDLKLSQVFFANLSYNDYQQAGFGANPAGATLDIDDFVLGDPGPAGGTLAWQPAKGAGPIAGYVVAVSDKPDTQPKGKVAQETTLNLSGLKDGPHYVHVRPQLPDGNWGPTAHYRVLVDGLPPRLDKNGSGGCEVTPDGRLVIHVTDAQGSGVDPSSLVLSVSGQDFTAASPPFRFDPVAETISLDLAAAGIQPAEDHSLEVKLAPVSDHAGNTMSGACNWTLHPSSEGKETPPAPTVTCATPYLIDDGFETAPVTWAAWNSSPVTMARDDSTAASGRYSLRIANQTDRSAFGVVPVAPPFNAGRYRLVSFDYKANDRIRADFIVAYDDRVRAVGFLDTATTLSRIGKILDVAADDQWHHAEFDLYDLMRKDDPAAPDYNVTTFAIGDYQIGSSSDSSNPRGATYHIDNFRILPVVSTRDGATFQWNLFDLDGIAGSSWVLDDKPDTEPAETVTGKGLTHTFPAANGPAYFHVRAQNGAGQWGPTAHYRVLLDGTPPSAGQPTPADGAADAPARITLPLSDEGIAGIDPGTIQMTIAGQAYDLHNSGLVYDCNAKRLTWRCERTSGGPRVLKDGQKVDVVVTAADLAGNPLPKPVAWSWTMDYSKDHAPPAIASLASSSHVVDFCDTFEKGLDGWEAFGGATAAQDTSAPASGADSLTMTVTNPAAEFGIRASKSFSAARTPILAFDYRVAAGTTVDLIVLVGNNWHAVKFTDTDGGQNAAIPNVVADGQWHHAQFNLGAMLQALLPDNKTLPVGGLGFTDRGNRATPAGAKFSIDNVIVTTSAGRAASLGWAATDPTGIAGYSYVLDQQPTTVPDETPEGSQTSFSAKDLPDGVSFFHVRAKDGAGNWGPAAHYALLAT